MSVVFLELPRTVLFLYPLPPLPDMEKLQKFFSDVRLAPHKLLVYVDAVIGLKLLATTLGKYYMIAVLQNFVLVKRLQRLESTYITGVNPLSLYCALSHHTDPIQQ